MLNGVFWCGRQDQCVLQVDVVPAVADDASCSNVFALHRSRSDLAASSSTSASAAGHAQRRRQTVPAYLHERGFQVVIEDHYMMEGVCHGLHPNPQPLCLLRLNGLPLVIDSFSAMCGFSCRHSDICIHKPYGFHICICRAQQQGMSDTIIGIEPHCSRNFMLLTHICQSRCL